MKLPKFNYELQKWDRFERFYCMPLMDHRFVQFETGEFILTSTKWAPEDRKFYKELNIQIVGSNDRDCPALFLEDGSPVLKSWLDVDGQQIFVIDHDTKQVRTITAHLGDKWLGVPASLAGCCSCYFSGPGRPPVAPVPQIRKTGTLSNEQKEKLDSLKAQVRMWYNMDHSQNRKHPTTPPSFDIYPEDRKALDIHQALSYNAMVDMPVQERLRLQLFGLTPYLVTTRHKLFIA